MSLFKIITIITSDEKLYSGNANRGDCKGIFGKLLQQKFLNNLLKIFSKTT